jgi:hypothetical protein
MKALIKHIFLLVTLLMLVSCGGTPDGPQDPTSPADAPAATATMEASPTPTPNPGLLLLAGEDVEGLQTALQAWALDRGWTFAVRSPADLDGWVDTPGLQAVVEIGSGLTMEELSSAAPEVLIVAVDHPDATPGGRLSTVGLYEARHDQAGFLAGVMTGLASQSWVVASVSGGGEHDAVYLAAFERGLKYGCPRCWPEMTGALGATADELVSRRVDAVFIAPGAGRLSPTFTTTGFLWFVYVQDAPPELSLDRIAGHVVFDSQPLVLEALEGLLTGDGGRAWPYAIDNGSMLIGSLNSEGISPGRQRLLEEAFELLASGELDVGGER